MVEMGETLMEVSIVSAECMIYMYYSIYYY